MPIFSEAFPSIEIDFVVREKENTSIVLNYVQKRDDKSCGVFRLVEQTGLHNYLVCKQGSNSLQVKRYKMTYDKFSILQSNFSALSHINALFPVQNMLYFSVKQKSFACLKKSYFSCLNFIFI